MSSNQIQFEFKSVKICSNLVREWFGLKFMNSNRESKLFFSNSIKFDLNRSENTQSYKFI
jgi:hypothetical protein